MLRRAVVLSLSCLGACAGPGHAPDTAAALAEALRSRPIVLLGEVHDHAEQHRQRLQAFDTLLASGARPALLLEQLDRDRQAEIDASRGSADAAARIAALAPRGWSWAHYAPFVERALGFNLPIVAANVSRSDARQVIARGLAAGGFVAEVPADIAAAQAAAIQASHCGMVDAAMAQRMAAAPVARDQQMARAIAHHAARGVVLLTGNGHARRDIGVPRWLDPSLQAQTLAIGMLEAGDGSAAAFDRVFFSPPQPRADPGASLRAAPAPGG